MTEKKYYKPINDWCERYCKNKSFFEAELHSLAN